MARLKFALELNEQLKEIAGFPNYQISNLGNVYRILKNKNLRRLKPRPAFGGYLQAVIFNGAKNRRPFYIHRMVAQSFCEKEAGSLVNHKNGNKLDNRSENLEWVTASENTRHSYELGLSKSGCNSKNSKLTENQVLSIYKLKGLKSSLKLAKEFKVSKPVILSIWNKTKYKKELAKI